MNGAYLMNKLLNSSCGHKSRTAGSSGLFSGARRQNKALDEVSAAILGGEAAENAKHNRTQKAERSGAFFYPSAFALILIYDRLPRFSGLVEKPLSKLQ